MLKLINKVFILVYLYVVIASPFAEAINISIYEQIDKEDWSQVRPASTQVKDFVKIKVSSLINANEESFWAIANDTIDEKTDGFFISFYDYEENKKKREGQIHKGKKVGVWIEYREDKTVFSRSIYNQEEFVKYYYGIDGKLKEKREDGKERIVYKYERREVTEANSVVVGGVYLEGEKDFFKGKIIRIETNVGEEFNVTEENYDGRELEHRYTVEDITLDWKGISDKNLEGVVVAGYVIEHHKNGIVKKEGNVDKEGNRIGLWKEYNENGTEEKVYFHYDQKVRNIQEISHTIEKILEKTKEVLQIEEDDRAEVSVKIETEAEAVNISFLNEIEELQEVYKETLKEIEELVKTRAIKPDVKININEKGEATEADKEKYPNRALKVGFFGIKGDPVQHGHILTALEAIAKYKLDKVVWVLDGFGNLDLDDVAETDIGSSDTERYEIRYQILKKALEPFGDLFEVTNISQQTLYEREINACRFSAMNEKITMELYYLVESESFTPPLFHHFLREGIDIPNEDKGFEYQFQKNSKWKTLRVKVAKVNQHYNLPTNHSIALLLYGDSIGLKNGLELLENATEMTNIGVIYDQDKKEIIIGEKTIKVATIQKRIGTSSIRIKNALKTTEEVIIMGKLLHYLPLSVIETIALQGLYESWRGMSTYLRTRLNFKESDSFFPTGPLHMVLGAVPTDEEQFIRLHQEGIKERSNTIKINLFFDEQNSLSINTINMFAIKLNIEKFINQLKKEGYVKTAINGQDVLTQKYFDEVNSSKDIKGEYSLNEFQNNRIKSILFNQFKDTIKLFKDNNIQEVQGNFNNINSFIYLRDQLKEANRTIDTIIFDANAVYFWNIWEVPEVASILHEMLSPGGAIHSSTRASTS